MRQAEPMSFVMSSKLAAATVKRPLLSFQRTTIKVLLQYSTLLWDPNWTFVAHTSNPTSHFSLTSEHIVVSDLNLGGCLVDYEDYNPSSNTPTNKYACI